MKITYLLVPSLCLLSSLHAQHYSKKILIKGLNAPHGIAVHASGDLYFTQVPEPGKFSQKNLVSLWDKKSAKVTNLVSGEPAPTHIVVRPDRTIYWTCKTAGVIMMRKGSTQKLVLSKLKRPSGIDVGASGDVYFTQIPTPGLPGNKGGKNELSLLSGGKVKTLAMGEPEPTDVVVDAKGNAWWTCRTAGVILRRDGKTGKIVKVLDRLEKPVGIAMDAKGHIYFTEVPTPGVFGNKGGRNKVWRYDPMHKALTLVSFGEPYPADVAVSSDGSHVYWTCMTVGVIFEAVRLKNSAQIEGDDASKIGKTTKLELRAAANAGMKIQAATAFGTGPISVDSRFLALSPDGLFFLTLLGQGQPVFTGFSGKLDAKGEAKIAIHIPNAPALKGLQLFTAYVVLDAKSTSGISALSNTHRLVIE